MSKKHYENSFPGKVAVVGNHTPRMCGIATFTADLCDAIARESSYGKICAVAMDDIPEGYNYPDMVRLQLQADNVEDFRNAADFINFNDIGLVLVEHEYGIYGGSAGSNIIDLMRMLHKPIVTTMHTVISNPNDDQRKVTQEIIRLSNRIVVMSNHAKGILESVYDDVDGSKFIMIPHGIPDVPFIDPNYHKDSFGIEGKKVILTFGLLSPGKGVEVMIEAMKKIVEKHSDAVFIVLGATHPNVKREYGEEYRESLITRTRELGLEDNIMFVDEFVSLKLLCEYIGAADVYVTPYHNREQITSGTLAYALGAGKAIVSTPYRYAEELLDDGRGVLVPFGDSDAFSDSIVSLFDCPAERHAIRKKAYHYGRDMVWSKVAVDYLKLFADVVEEQSTYPRPVGLDFSIGEEELSLPDINMQHLRTMTDDTGILQHAQFAIPNRYHGYCTDDNARALIAVSKYYNLSGDRSCLPYASTYLAFLFSAFDEESKRFRNFMSYDRKWLDDVGSDDSHARALWGLGVAVSSKLDISFVKLSSRLFVEALGALENSSSPRSWSFVLLGIYHYLERFGGDVTVKRMGKLLAERLFNLFKEHSTPDWPWCEHSLSYTNARLSQALILSGKWLRNPEMMQLGLSSLKWLLEVQTGENGQISIVGNRGWRQKGGVSARFDQQPIDTGALVETCSCAYKLTGDKYWYSEASRCFKWFLGYNDLQISLYDPNTGGCQDGLHAIGANGNQGAESTLAWFLALVDMHEISLKDDAAVSGKSLLNMLKQTKVGTGT